MDFIKKSLKFYFSACILSATLTGCSTVSTPPAAPDSKVSWQTRKNILSRLQNWKVSGKIAVNTPQESATASIDWSQHAQNFRISLFGPIGTSGVKITGAPGNVTMITGSGKKFTARTPEELLTQQLGWKLPVSYLKYWIRGLPVPGSVQKSSFDTSHRLTLLKQKGFNVKFQRYTNKNGTDLPQKLSITSSAIRSKIIIYNWQIGR